MTRHIWLVASYLLSALAPLIIPIARNFEYEYTLLTALALIFFVFLAALLTPQRHIPQYGHLYIPWRSFETLWLCLIAPVIIVLPAAMAYLFSWCSCSGPGFSFWTVIQLIPAIWVAHAIYHLIMTLRCRGVSCQKLAVVSLACFIALTIYLGAAIWLNPQVRITHLLFGFLHGPIYDHWIAVDEGIFFARLTHLLIGALIISLLFIKFEVKYFWIYLVIIISMITTGKLATRYPSTWIGKSSLDKLFNQKMRYGDFTLYAVDHDQANLKSMAQQIQFHIHELKKLLPPNSSAPHVHVYLYPDQDRKKLWFGGGATDVTDVYTPSIHISMSQQFPHPTLRHELVHAVFSKIAFHGLGFHPNIVLTEGLAVTLAPEQREISLDLGAASLIQQGRIGNPQKLFSPLFWAESGARSYTIAGSLLQFINRHFGSKSLINLYADQSIKDALGRDIDQLILQWKQEVLQKFDQNKDKLLTESLFRYSGVLFDRCPHSKEDLRKSRSSHLFVRLRQPIGWSPREKYWLWRIQMDPTDKYARYAYWRQNIHELSEELSPNTGAIKTWIRAIRAYRSWPPQDEEDIELAILESDAYRLIGKSIESQKILTQLQGILTEKRIHSSLVRKIYARLMVEKSLSDTQALTWRRYLAGWRSVIPQPNLRDPWIVVYLQLRRQESTFEDKNLLHQLFVLSPNDPLPSTFIEEWYRLLGQRLLKAQSYQMATQAYEKAAQAAPHNTAYYKMLTRYSLWLAKLTKIKPLKKQQR